VNLYVAIACALISGRFQCKNSVSQVENEFSRPQEWSLVHLKMQCFLLESRAASLSSTSFLSTFHCIVISRRHGMSSEKINWTTCTYKSDLSQIKVGPIRDSFWKQMCHFGEIYFGANKRQDSIKCFASFLKEKYTL